MYPAKGRYFDNMLVLLLKSSDNIPVLQYRWALHRGSQDAGLVYYGVRNYPNQGQNMIRISSQAADLIAGFDENKSWRMISGSPECTENVFGELAWLFAQKVIVNNNDLKKPATFQQNQSCVRCVNNDYLIPGLEFDERGICSICQCYENADQSVSDPQVISDEEILTLAKKNSKSRYDAMVLYTGGKDSSYLLWYLARKLKIRVLAATLNMPYTNDCAKQNIYRAKTILHDVDFVEKTISQDLIYSSMCQMMRRVGTPCFCYLLAVVVFYPLAALEKIPLMMEGTEDNQKSMAYLLSAANGIRIPSNLKDQTNTLLKLLAYSNKAEGVWRGNDLLATISCLRESLGIYYNPLLEVISRAENPDSPKIKRLGGANADISWQDKVNLIARDLGWQMPVGQDKLLHTSCRLEGVKDYLQLNNFRNMRSTSLPQSVVEISAAVYTGMISREEGLKELSAQGYFQRPNMLDQLLEDLQLTDY